MKQKLINLFKQYNIYWTEEGANVRKNNINIKCPWCGEADPSEHMGINPVSKQYACWRNSQHRGKDLARLIQVLIHCSYLEAKRLVENDRLVFQEKGILDQVVETLTISDDDKRIERLGGVKKLELPKNFYLADVSSLRIRFQEYLFSRGFINVHVNELDQFILKYGICCCLVGDYKFRLIFPIYYKNQLVTWTSRSIYVDEKLRYKDLSIEESVRHVKFCLYNYDELLEKGGKKLFITEGVFDVLKMEYFFPNEDYRATCIFTTSVQPEQVYLLSKLSKRFNDTILLLDKGVEAQMIRLKMEFSFIKNLSFSYLPRGVNDPGDMSKEQVRGYCA